MQTQPPPITPLEFNDRDFEKAEKLAIALGYEQTAYTSTSALWGLFCLPENPEHSKGPTHGGCIIKTREFGLMFVQDTEDITGEIDGDFNAPGLPLGLEPGGRWERAITPVSEHRGNKVSMKTHEGKTRKTFKVEMFRGDMGSYTTNAHSWEDLLWHVNSARDHDGLEHITLEQLKDCRPKNHGIGLNTMSKTKTTKAELPQGTPVMCNGYRGAIVRHYSGNMYEIRMGNAGVICTGEFQVIQPQAQHSPLPWHIEASTNHMTWLCSDRKHIATIMDRDVSIDEDARIQDANARLIVASVNHAQALAEACNSISKLSEGWTSEQMNYAIRKAQTALAAWEAAQ